MRNFLGKVSPGPLPVLLFTLLLVPCISVPLHGGDDYYIVPKLESECPYNNSAEQQCMTLNDFATMNTSDQSFEYNNVRMIFFGGVHYLSEALNLSGVENVRMTSANSMKEFYNDSDVVEIRVMNTEMIFDSVGGLFLENLVIIGANLILENTPKRQANIQGVHFFQSSLIHRFHFETKDQASPNDNVLYSNATAPLHTNIRIENSILENSSGTGFQVMDERVHGDLKIDIQNCSISNHKQGGLIIESSVNLHFTITDSIVESNSIGESRKLYSAAAGLGVYSNRPDSARVTIRGTIFANNRDLGGVPTVVSVSRAVSVEVEDSEFQNNRGTAIRAANIKDTLRLQGNVTFRNNMAQRGGGLALLSTMVDFMPNSYIVFEGNRANSVGGAIFVETSSTLYEENNPITFVPCFYRFSGMNSDDSVRNLTFGNNSAVGGGHVLYGASLKSYCLVDKMRPGDDYPIRSGDQLVQDGFLFNETTDEYTSSLISSQPSRVCVINLEDSSSEKSISEYCANASQIFMTISTYPGEEFNLNVVLVGAEFGTTTGEVYAQFLPFHDNPPLLQSSYQRLQKVTQLNSPQSLSYSVLSRNAFEVLVLTTTAGTMLSYGDEDQILEDLETYNTPSVIPIGLLTTPIYINVSISKCPSGFYLDMVTMRCKCNPQVCNTADENKEAEQRGLLYLGDNLWVNAYDDGNINGIIVHYNCPYSYCKESSSVGIDLSNPDTQCAMDHAGILCGKCDDGYSMVLGSDKCLPCSNDNIALIIFFGLAGFFLVFAIQILNLTVTQGTISGLLFYVNIVWAYRSIFFAHHDDWFLKMFIAWLNLDFGIEACFSKGLTAYGKSWMQYMFPLYIWLITGSLVLLVYISEKLAERYGNRWPVRILVWISNAIGHNPTQLFATLFIMSYAKLLRASITALIPAHLYVYTDSGERVDSLTKMVWAFDGNLVWGQVPHIFLLLLALMVLIGLLLPYTALLLFVQPISMMTSTFRCLKWIDKLKPFFDAYTGPFNPQNHFWVGLLLLTRFILILTFTVTYAGSPSASLVAMVIIIVILLGILTYTGRLYNDPMKVGICFLPKEISFRSLLEVSFLLNLVILGVSVLSVDFITGHVRTKAAILYTSVITAFFQFVGIIVYHAWCVLMNNTCGSDFNTCSCIKRSAYKDLDAEDDDSTAAASPAMVTCLETNREEEYQSSLPCNIHDTVKPAAYTSRSAASTEDTSGISKAEYHTSYDRSDLSKPKITKFESSATDSKDQPQGYSSTKACKSKLTDSITKIDLSTFTDSSEYRKPILTNSTKSKDNHLSYSSLELRKPALSDSASA